MGNKIYSGEQLTFDIHEGENGGFATFDLILKTEVIPFPTPDIMLQLIPGCYVLNLNLWKTRFLNDTPSIHPFAFTFRGVTCHVFCISKCDNVQGTRTGVPLTYVYPWYLLCFPGILGDYDP